jgi:hypothetical protein
VGRDIGGARAGCCVGAILYGVEWIMGCGCGHVGMMGGG